MTVVVALVFSIQEYPLMPSYDKPSACQRFENPYQKSIAANPDPWFELLRSFLNPDSS
jgi:hypothetical protein